MASVLTGPHWSPLVPPSVPQGPQGLGMSTQRRTSDDKSTAPHYDVADGFDFLFFSSLADTSKDIPPVLPLSCEWKLVLAFFIARIWLTPCLLSIERAFASKCLSQGSSIVEKREGAESLPRTSMPSESEGSIEKLPEIRLQPCFRGET